MSPSPVTKASRRPKAYRPSRSPAPSIWPLKMTMDIFSAPSGNISIEWTRLPTLIPASTLVLFSGSIPMMASVTRPPV